MGIRPLNNCGYTLMELIMAIAIIASLSAVAVPNYARYLERTREDVCMINRQTIIYEYRLYCINEPEIPLSDYIRMYYAEESCLCPSGGSYSAIGSGGTAELKCSVHRDVTTEAWVIQ